MIGAEIHQRADEAALQHGGTDQGGADLTILAADAVFVALHAALALARAAQGLIPQFSNLATIAGIGIGLDKPILRRRYIFQGIAINAGELLVDVVDVLIIGKSGDDDTDR